MKRNSPAGSMKQIEKELAEPECAGKSDNEKPTVDERKASKQAKYSIGKTYSFYIIYSILQILRNGA